MSAGYRSLLARHLGGAAAGTAVPGNITPWPGYLGGAGSVPVVAGPPGYRSLLAYWLGGAGATVSVVPPEPGAGGGGGPSLRARKGEDWFRRISRDDEEIIMLIPELWTVIHHED